MSRRLQPADNLLAPAVHDTIKSLQTGPEDTGAVRLAQRYATAIDQAPDPVEALATLGPKLLAALESLGATPKARAAMKSGGPAGPTGKLAALRAARGA